MMYRYTIHKYEWNNANSDWQPFLDYVRNHFSHVTIPSDEVIYFNATPKQLRQAALTLRINTTSFTILTTSELEPSTHEE